VSERRLLLTIQETADLLNVSRSHLYRLIQRGELPVVRVGGCTRVHRVALERMLAEHLPQRAQPVSDDAEGPR
jgi:excisionase family DNA binding protein